MNQGLVRCKVREGRGRRHRPVRGGRRLPSAGDFFRWGREQLSQDRTGNSGLALLFACRCGLFRGRPHNRVGCSCAHERMGERAIASIWHYKDKRKQTQKRSGLTTARASSQADRALRSAWKRGGWGRYFGLLYVTEWPLSAASSSDSDTACAIIRGPLVAVSYAKYFQVAG